MLSIRGCPHCGESPEIKVIIRDYGFNGVVIECPNCKAQIRNAKCMEMIVRPEDGMLSNPITEESLFVGSDQNVESQTQKIQCGGGRMTFSELMRATYHMQTVMLVIGEGESITGNAEAMDGYLNNEVTNANVAEINIEDSIMKVWLE